MAITIPLRKIVADVIIITVAEFLTIHADVFSISIHLIADVALWHQTRVAVAINVIVTITAAVIITTAVVMMLHRSLILAETTVADVTETKENAGGHRYSMPSLL